MIRAEGFDHRRAGLVRVDDMDLGARQSRRQCGGHEAHHSGADHHDPVARPGARIPDRVERRLHIGGKRRAARRDAGGNAAQGGNRQDETALVRVEAEDFGAEPVGGAGFHDSAAA